MEWGLGDQSGLRPANFTTLAHFSVSSAISVRKSAGEPGSTVPPKSESRALTLGSASAALNALLSVSRMPKGVFLGAPTPTQPLDFISRYKITHGRNVGQGLRADRSRHRQGSKSAGPDVLNRRGHGVEHHLHLAT